MPKRFLDNEFFKKPLIRSFEAPYKLLYLFIICDCDNAGIWNPDFEVASIYTGQKITKDVAVKKLSGKFTELQNGQWFFPGFIRHQYPNGLQNSNPAHKKIIERLFFLKLIDNELNIKEPSKPLARPFKGSKVEVKVMVEDKVVVKEEVMVVVLPFDSENFLKNWEIWKTYKKDQHKFTYKSPITEQAALNDLVSLSEGREDKAVEIIMQSISKSWKGFFELKNNSNGKQSAGTLREQVQAEHNRRSKERQQTGT